MAAQLWMRASRESTHNEIEFRNYRKFGTESTITYDIDEASKPLPASKTQEQPATASPSVTPSTPSNSEQKPAPQKKANPWTLPTAPPPPPQ
jgi:hypothetical protein